MKKVHISYISFTSIYNSTCSSKPNELIKKKFYRSYISLYTYMYIFYNHKIIRKNKKKLFLSNKLDSYISLANLSYTCWKWKYGLFVLIFLVSWVVILVIWVVFLVIWAVFLVSWVAFLVIWAVFLVSWVVFLVSWVIFLVSWVIFLVSWVIFLVRWVVFLIIGWFCVTEGPWLLLIRF